ncbi:hypothetical protein J2Q11_12170 [Tenacibaculum finnmarkense genomovar finnmarkense]|uniref:Uncharacterized protein n=1 Tax=Tenacibaculum finnmarkense genomovar finnmarkense TaxID=1458503 RepID=A0AAP1WH75_9FLAO|nr:hypothetical protein [Tenacibaculum finnmarkense]MBE7635045.1 hypothetical protein [Tenacibaculum finnmarkense genomovar ulcerans]MBE7649128.1 hypothetical protein [Tenacibaculum finnmarkense genomovar ulcerans]MBE7653837.1 hypothetical protein [Tenacibaculum finnmarkense genomovar finnmarkense]MBE7661034.1 hypothetical protein [Tenacibaculum finnmarkense genomovar finnmarkense]MBE7696141.1 hypothetical protein [Tenacibaculum finnmarkense genomovar finnmarkense]
MKPLNYKKRRASQLRFLLVFSITLTLLFCSSLFAIYTGKKGIDVLEKKHAEYNDIFEKQAFITFKIDEMTKYLYRLKNKKRTLGEHKQFQGLISNMRTNVEREIKNTASSIENQFQLYIELLRQIKEIQAVVDNYENESEEYLYNKELLEKCREKYRSEGGKSKK